MIDTKVFEFPIIYSSHMGRYAIGWGAHQTVGDECKSANIKKALIVTTGLKGTGIVDEIKSILNYHGIATDIFDKITSNPKDHQVMEGYRAFANAQCDGVVSVGGGSSHDAAKCIRAVAANEGKYVCEMAMTFGPGGPKEVAGCKPVTIPQICINTTAGTGAEVSTAGIVTDTRVRVKQIIVLPGTVPAIGIVDPLLMRSMPPSLAAYTGFDALAHGFECFLSRIQVPHTNGLALQLIKLVAENIREFTHNRMNHKACESMCWAESMGGFTVLFGAGGGIVHGISHQLSAITDCHHGRANAVMALAGERYNESACPERFAELARAMGIDTRGINRIQAADKWLEAIERLLKDLNILPGHLNQQFGLQENDIDHVVKMYSRDISRFGNPRDYNYQETYDLVKSVF